MPEALMVPLFRLTFDELPEMLLPTVNCPVVRVPAAVYKVVEVPVVPAATVTFAASATGVLGITVVVPAAERTASSVVVGTPVDQFNVSNQLPPVGPVYVVVAAEREAIENKAVTAARRPPPRLKSVIRFLISVIIPHKCPNSPCLAWMGVPIIRLLVPFFPLRHFFFFPQKRCFSSLRKRPAIFHDVRHTPEYILPDDSELRRTGRLPGKYPKAPPFGEHLWHAGAFRKKRFVRRGKIKLLQDTRRMISASRSPAA